MIWIAAGFSLCMLIYVGFVLRSTWHFMRIPCASPATFQLRPMVSVVIPARNEASNLARCLRSVLYQSYPAEFFEVILVNDHSTDATAAIAYVMAQTYPHLRVIDLQLDGPTVAYKKAALTAGVKAARGEIILQTDADCEVPDTWIECMVSHMGPKTGLVAGPVLLTHHDHWLQRLQTLELMGLVVLGGGSMAARQPNLANGANLGYRRAVFGEVNGFEGIDRVASGDDELLLQKIHRLGKYELRFVRCRSALVRTPAQATWPELKAQRLRWVSKARFYLNRWPNLIQAISYLAFLGLPTLAVLGFWQPSAAGLALQLFALKAIADLLLMYQAGRFFRNLPLLKWLPLLEVVYIPYVLWVGLVGNLVKHYRWKDRIVS
jgi:cellulose synthase/poly-beta-1,6-N-acetylglucosamine synthase-like glycosyltransferase